MVVTVLTLTIIKRLCFHLIVPRFELHKCSEYDML